jgi:large subunit ribosomal protein L21
MYAVIKAGGKQQRVQAGDVIEVELTHGQRDDRVTFTPLMVVDDDGKAHVGKELGRAVVKAKLVGEKKGDKVKVFKYRPKTGYARHQGHRQLYTLVEIEDVSLGGRRATKKSEDDAKAQDQSQPEDVTAAASVDAPPSPAASKPSAPRKKPAATQPEAEESAD